MARLFSFRTTAALTAVVLLLLVLHATGASSLVERSIVTSIRPLQHFLYGLAGPIRGGSDDPNTKEREQQLAKLIVENARLKEERSQLLAQLEQQGFLQERGFQGVAASIIGRSPEGDEQVYILNRGTEVGVRPGQPVIAEEGVLIGTVYESESGRSSVLLVTNTQISVGAEVQNTTRSPGIVSGQHGLTMRMQFIPQNETVEKGGVVVTSAIDERIPANLVIGEISDIHFTVGDLFQEASLRTFIDLQRLRYVTILQKT